MSMEQAGQATWFFRGECGDICIGKGTGDISDIPSFDVTVIIMIGE